MTLRHRVWPAALLAALAGCAPTVVPQPTPRPAPAPPPPVVQQQPGPDLQDWAVTPGTWSYASVNTGTIARFGMPGAPPVAWLRCDLASRHVVVWRSAVTATSAMLGVVTSFGRTDWPAAPVAGGLEATRGAADPGLDAVAFSRGRFALILANETPVVLPSWAEPARVIEDCRG